MAEIDNSFRAEGELDRPDECPSCGCGLFVQAKPMTFEIRT